MQATFGFVEEAAKILKNADEARGPIVRQRYEDLLTRIRRKAGGRGDRAEALRHFVKVTQSYWPGLFHCYEVPDLPRTNNALEQLFGSTRHHERRCTGRKAASPSLVLRGSVRIVAGLGTRLREFDGRDLQPESGERWRALRASIEKKRLARAQRFRFRKDPAAYLREMESLAIKGLLPT